MDFSVLVSVYYKESPRYLDEALNSLFSQTLLPTEVILVKDGPLTPELDAVILQYVERHPIFKIIENKTNSGLGPALAKGIQHCSYEYIARMDTDDVMAFDRFEKQLKKMEEGYDVVSCWSGPFKTAPSDLITIRQRPEHHEDIVRLAHKRSPVCHASCILRKKAVLDAGNYQRCYLYEDYHLWVRMIMNGSRFYNVQEVLYYVRTSPELISRRGGLKYMMNETKTFLFFYRIGFYSLKDLVINIMTHAPVRIMPARLRKIILIGLWRR